MPTIVHKYGSEFAQHTGVICADSTPTFVVESEVAMGALNLATFQSLIGKAQAKKFELLSDK